MVIGGFIYETENEGKQNQKFLKASEIANMAYLNFKFLLGPVKGEYGICW